jgi:hypothetical protein
MQASVAGVSVSGNTDAASAATWVEVLDEATGRNFWFNADTGDSTWTSPFPAQVDHHPVEGEDAWEVKHDPTTKRNYFWNTVTRESSWDDPRRGAEGDQASARDVQDAHAGVIPRPEADPASPQPGLTCLDSSGDWQVRFNSMLCLHSPLWC